MRSLLLLLLLVTPLRAQVTAVIGPTTARPGQFVLLTAKDAADASWLMLAPDVATIQGNGGQQFAFFIRDNAKRGDLYSAALVVVNFEKRTFEIQKHRVEVNENAPEPEPPPEPQPPTPPIPPTPVPPTPVPPPPDPVLPDGKYKLAAFARDAVAANVPVGMRKYAPSVGDNFGAVAATLAAGVGDLEDATLDLKARNRATLGADVQLWIPWFEALKAELDKFVAAKSLETNEDFATAWREIAMGLKAVRTTAPRRGLYVSQRLTR